MKFSIFVFACVLATAISIPIDRNLMKSKLEGSSTAETNTTIKPSSIESTTTVKSTDVSSTVPSETTTVVKHDKTTAIVEVTTATTRKEPTKALTSTTVPSSTTVLSSTTVKSSTTVATPKTKVSDVETKAEPAPVVIETTKKSPEARKGRGSKKFNMVENPEGRYLEKPKEVTKPVDEPKEEVKLVEKPKEEPTEKEPEQKPQEAPKDEKPEEKKPEAEAEEKKPEAEEEKEEEKEKENQHEQKQKEADDDESMPIIRGKVVPAVAQPRLLSAEERRKGRKYKDIQIVQLESELEENGKYHFNYENEDGTIVHQSGEMKMMDHDGEKMMGESVEGSYSYKDDDGNTISVTYTADENGFRPVGAHIPTIPPAIARSLAWQATAKPWVDPWVVEQEALRKARKISKESEEISKE